jgi:hypothetical protein
MNRGGAGARSLIARFDGRSVTYGFGELDTLVPAYAATIHKSQGSEYPASSSRCSPSIMPCCSGTCSIPASRAARSWSYWSDRGRRSRSRCTTCRGGGGGRSSASGCGQNRLSHNNSSWPVEPWSLRIFCRTARSGNGSTASSGLDGAHLRQLQALRLERYDPRSQGRQTV